ncbi:MAG: ABC transporter ATP-binding protein [Formivibrio sp.]|nr:ABC transporter ATP-binding protein [Formivibrio sp.]
MNPSEFAIDVQGLTKRYGDKTVVDGLSMQVRRGEVFGFLGPNGSGKTTTFRMMCGLLTPDGGEGHTLGYNILREASAIKREVGYMTQRFGLYEDLSIRENLDFIAQIYQMDQRRHRVDLALERLGLQARQHQLAGGLSGGWKQRLALASCMLHEPRLLLLDEPTAGVDPKARRDFWEEIHKLAANGITVLVSTHYMDEAERCHRLGYIAYGRLMALGTPNELVERSNFVTWYVTGEALNRLADELHGKSGVTMVTRFGNTLHVSGERELELDAAIAPFRTNSVQQWMLGKLQLEDLFIHLMGKAQDNFE